MAIDGTGWKGLYNQSWANSMNSLFGSNNQSSSGLGGLSGDMINQWNMLKANSKAYSKLLQAQETGTIRQKQDMTLLSDKLLNDYYDKGTGKIKQATYASPSTPTAAKEDLSKQLESIQNLAKAAASNPDSLTDSHYSLFETLRKNIAGALETKSDSSKSTSTTEAQAATLKGTADFRYLDEAQSFKVTGNKGSKSYSFEEGASLQSIADAINADTSSTGVIAELEKDASGQVINITLSSETTGKDAMVWIDQDTGSLFTTAGGTRGTTGVDATKKDDDVVARGGDARAALATGVYGGKLSGDQEFTIEGPSGSKTFKFEGGTSAEDVITAINDANLGITASAIRNVNGDLEGIGLESDSLGDDQRIRISQAEGYLFASPGSNVNVQGRSENPTGANKINSLDQLGKVTIGNETYSFADLAPGGRASLDKNPNAAVMILDQALRDIFSGDAVLKGLDLDEAKSLTTNTSALLNSGDKTTKTDNAVGLNDFGSDALKNWVSSRLLKDS